MILRLLLTLSLVAWATPAWATDYGWDFRQTSGFVTDSAPQTYVLSSDVYPVTRNGITFGWSGGANDTDSRDRNNGVDARFAGTIFNNSANPAILKIDLPSTGDWTIRASLGDHDGAQSNIVVSFREGTTAFATVGPTSTSGASKYLDATGVERSSEADWISNNASITHTFTTTSFNVYLGNGTNLGFITHVLISPASSAPVRHRVITQ